MKKLITNAALKRLILAVGLSAAALGGAPTQAGLILQDDFNNFRCLCSGSVAQTFTAEDAGIDSIGFRLGDVNTHLGTLDFRVSLFEGVGFAGANLGSTDRSFASLDQVWSAVLAFQDFDFSSVVLTVGNTYTALIEGIDSTRGGVKTFNDGNPYTGGVWLLDGVPNNGDTAFRVIPRATVPAPATLALFGLGLAGLGWSRHKKA